MTNWLLAGFLLLALASAVLLFNRFRVTRQQKQIIEGEKVKLDQANGNLNAANAKLKELDDFKSHFFTNISHEFRTPLTVINGMARQIRQEPTRWLDKGADMIERNSDGLLHLVNQILDLRKLEAGKLSLHLIQDDIIAFVRYNTGVFESLAQSRGVSLSFESKEEQLMMDFDPEKLSQILQNLLSNAIKFTPEEGEVSCLIRLKDPHMLEIQIKDTGMGISEEKLPMIFERFYQVDSTDTRQEEGTGIGLSLTKELVQLMDGRIHVESQENKGTMFQVLLPIRQEAEEQVAAKWMGKGDAHSVFSLPQISQSKESLSFTKRPQLLIIEDNSDVVTYLHSCLEETYDLSSAFDGEEGIDIALESVPDLIITDVMMPKKNGYEVTEILKQDERTSHIPIVMLTAKADQGARIEGYKRGADAYLTKPFDQEELRVRLEKLWEIRQTLQKRYQGNTTPTPTEDPAIQQEDAFIQKVRGLVMNNLDDTSYKVDAMLKDLGISRTNFHRKVKALTGKTPSHFIRSIRVHHAQQLLKQSPDMQISEVAYAVGFADPAYFGRVFHERTGTSPGEWREKHK
ncbi:MAG: ATP-binding protein [Bacteroidota bacterium]